VSQFRYSLSQLQAMTAEELIAAFPQKKTRWVNMGYKVDAKQLIKAIILATRDLHIPVTDNRGNREVWYNPVKPILLKVERTRIEDPKTDYMGYFEQIFSDMVKDGVLTYADLGINDFRTLKETFNIEQKKAQCWSNILLFIEKDSAYVHLQPLKELFNISIISGGGWSHTAGIERQLRSLQEKGISEVVVFTVTDYDPFGFAIDHEFVSKCETLGLEITEHHRIGVNVEHATPEILDVQKYPIKRGRKLSVEGVSFNSEEWLADYGIEGTYGLEIEAISAQPNGHQFLREIVAQELLKYLDESDRIEEITSYAWKTTPYAALQNLMYSIDQTEIDPVDVTETPQEFPNEYLDRSDYDDRVEPIEEEKEKATEELTDLIDQYEDIIADLEAQKESIEEPFDKQIEEIANDYWASRRMLVYCLWQYYNKNKEKFRREDYSLGYPKDCLLDAVKQNKNLNAFVNQLETLQLEKDVRTLLYEAMKNGAIVEMLNKLLDDANNGDIEQ
jgi:hypothetical protein